MTRTSTVALVFLATIGSIRAQEEGRTAESRPAAETAPAPAAPAPSGPTLRDSREAMSKWIETQQIISKERKDWQQGREILLGRIEVVRQENTTLQEKLKTAEGGVAEAEARKKELVDENDKLKAAIARLATTVSSLEAEVKRLFKRLPEPIQTKLQPLHQRIPEDPANTRVSAAERFQNVLGILNEVNKANNEILVNYEVHTLADGKASEVKAIYVGLGQAYYVSARGEAGIGRPTDDGWKWEPSPDAARNVALALEILENKHSPAFVPLPVKLK